MCQHSAQRRNLLIALNAISMQVPMQLHRPPPAHFGWPKEEWAINPGQGWISASVLHYVPYGCSLNGR